MRHVAATLLSIGAGGGRLNSWARHPARRHGQNPWRCTKPTRRHRGRRTDKKTELAGAEAFASAPRRVLATSDRHALLRASFRQRLAPVFREQPLCASPDHTALRPVGPVSRNHSDSDRRLTAAWPLSGILTSPTRTRRAGRELIYDSFAARSKRFGYTSRGGRRRWSESSPDA